MKLKHYKAYELVSEAVYKREGEKALKYITHNILMTLEQLHSFFSSHFIGKVKVVVNDWHWGGTFQNRGYRDVPLKSSPDSEHNNGNAIDFDVYVNKVRIPPVRIRTLILTHRFFFTAIMRIEADVNWVHVDAKLPPIIVFKKSPP